MSLHTRESWKRSGCPAVFAAILSGLLLYLSSPGPSGTGILAWVALIPLLWASGRLRPGRAALAGLLAGLVYYTLLLRWILIVLGTYGHLSWWIAALALLLLSLYMSFYTAIFSAGVSWAKCAVPSLWAGPVLWVALDLVRSRLFSGFPWQDLAYTQYLFPFLIQPADLFGHYGITFLIVLVNGIILAGLSSAMERTGKALPAGRNWKTSWAVVVPAVLLAVAAFVYGLLRQDQMERIISGADKMNIAVIQGNIDQDRKWEPSLQNEAVNTYIQLSESALEGKKLDLLVWPETALPFFPLEAGLFARQVSQMASQRGVCVITGAPYRELSIDSGMLKYYNSAFLISSDGQVTGRYDKQHLVPFGEYIPLRQILPIPEPLVETVADFTPGVFSGPVSCQNARIGVLICYESIFPELVREQVASGANLLVNLTNDAWFGRSGAPWQHLSMAVFRSVESRTSLARAANTGISGFVDPVGRLRGISPLFAPYFGIEQVPLVGGKTFYLAYGHWFAPLCLFFLFPGAVLVWRARESETEREP